MRLKYHDGATWIAGVLRSTEPAILALESQTEIHTTRQILADGVRACHLTAGRRKIMPIMHLQNECWR